MTFARTVTFFLSGYIIGAVIATAVVWFEEGISFDIVSILGFSLPVSAFYFFGLIALGNWRFLTLTAAGTVIAGLLCALYPAVSGFVPVYFWRVRYAIPIALIQFLLLVGCCAIFARFRRA
jgi:hypothetical protein